MNRLHRDSVPAFTGVLLLAVLATGIALATMHRPSAAAERPNVVLINCDNLGYGDVGPFGSTRMRTPHLDRMAAEGVRFTDFYATSGVCTPSRASLLTGCYPRRVNLHVDERGGLVLRPVSPKGLHPDEITIAEILKAQGYATACIGKWHLGDQPEFLPTRQGFDTYFGIPYSDDMTAPPPLPLMRDETVVEAPADRNTLTRRYTEEAIRWIAAHKTGPFFIYLAHAMPGSTPTPFASDPFRGKSAGGPWGDAVEEIDWSSGELLAALRREGLDESTLVIWTSDNGAPQRRPPQGSNAPLRGWGYTTAEGGMRVPCLMRWPGKIPAGSTCRQLCATIDLLPTLARLAGAEPPTDRVIDGRDIWPLMAGEPGGKSPHEAFYYYRGEQLQAVRVGKWKLYLPLAAKQLGLGAQTETSRVHLYDLETDVSETANLAEGHPEIVRSMLRAAERAREDLGDVGHPGKHQRPAGWVDHPTPREK